MDARKESLLKEIVECYIKTAKPVGSKALCDTLHCSSATIRNEMSELEGMGLLEKNHISSGRIPSESGYKYYVQHLMQPKELTGEDMLKLQKIFQNRDLVLTDAVNQCVEIISEITNYTSLVLGKQSMHNSLQQISIIPLQDNRIVALVCTDKGIVKDKQFTLPKNTDIDEIVKTSEIINRMLVGTPIDEVSERLEYEVKPIISKRVKQYETVYNIFCDAFQSFAQNNSNFHFVGKTKLFEQPEYNSVEEIKRLASKFEDESLIKKIEEKKEDNAVNIYIGDETEFDSNVTVIKSTYKINGEEQTIAIVGPKRMQYAKVVGLLEYIRENLEERE